MAEAIAVEDMSRLFFQSLLLGTGTFYQLGIHVQSFQWLQPSWVCSPSASGFLAFQCGTAAEGDKVMSLELWEIPSVLSLTYSPSSGSWDYCEK